MNDAERDRFRERARVLREKYGIKFEENWGSDSFNPGGSSLMLKFENPRAAYYFKLWLCELGEQDYWDWMNIRESEERNGSITGCRFDYHQKGDIPIECGRLDEDE